MRCNGLRRLCGSSVLPTTHPGSGLTCFSPKWLMTRYPKEDGHLINVERLSAFTLVIVIALAAGMRSLAFLAEFCCHLWHPPSMYETHFHATVSPIRDALTAILRKA